MRWISVAAITAAFIYIQIAASERIFHSPVPHSATAPDCRPYTSAAPTLSQPSRDSAWGPSSTTCAQACQAGGDLEPVPSNCLWSCENCNTQFWDWVCQHRKGLCRVTISSELSPRSEEGPLSNSVDGIISPPVSLLPTSSSDFSRFVSPLSIPTQDIEAQSEADVIVPEPTKDTDSDDEEMSAGLENPINTSTLNVSVPDHDSVPALNITLSDLVHRGAVAIKDILRCGEVCGHECASTLFCDDLSVCAQHCLSDSGKFEKAWHRCKKNMEKNSHHCSIMLGFSRVNVEITPFTATKCKRPTYRAKAEKGERPLRDCKKQRSLKSQAEHKDQEPSQTSHQMVSGLVARKLRAPPDCRPHTSHVPDPTPTSKHPQWGPGDVTCSEACQRYGRSMYRYPVDCMWSCTNCNTQFWKFACDFATPACNVTDWPVVGKPSELARAVTTTVNLGAASVIKQFSIDGSSTTLTTAKTKPTSVLKKKEEGSEEIAAGKFAEKPNIQALPSLNPNDPNLDKTLLDLANVTSPDISILAVVTRNDIHRCAEACGSHCASQLFCNNQKLCAQYCISDSKWFKKKWDNCRYNTEVYVRLCDQLVRERKRTMIPIDLHSAAKCKKLDYPPVWEGKKLPGWAEVDCSREDLPEE